MKVRTSWTKKTALKYFLLGPSAQKIFGSFYNTVVL